MVTSNTGTSKTGTSKIEIIGKSRKNNGNIENGNIDKVVWKISKIP